MRRLVVAGLVTVISSTTASLLPAVANQGGSPYFASCGGGQGVFMARVRYNPPDAATHTNNSLDHERVVITNRTAHSQSLQGWTLRDAKGRFSRDGQPKADHVFTLPRTTLRAGRALVVHTGKGRQAGPNRYWDRTQPIWNKTDKAILRNSKGALVDTCAWPTAAHGHAPTTTHPQKLLVIVEENHSFGQMQTGMPYLASLAEAYGYAANYKAITHPSLPNYLSIAGGSTFGVTDDNFPSAHPISASSVFDQAIANHLTAGVYADAMPSNCALTNSGGYAVKHNPWAYFTPGRSDCQKYDRPETSFLADARANKLPNAGMLIPDICNDAHSCPLSTADNWLKAHLPTVLTSSDFTSGRLAVVITADEDDRSSGNHVLTVVLAANLSGDVVAKPLTHYSLSRFYSETVGAQPLKNAQQATDLRAAFGL